MAARLRIPRALAVAFVGSATTIAVSFAGCDDQEKAPGSDNDPASVVHDGRVDGEVDGDALADAMTDAQADAAIAAVDAAADGAIDAASDARPDAPAT